MGICLQTPSPLQSQSQLHVAAAGPALSARRAASQRNFIDVLHEAAGRAADGESVRVRGAGAQCARPCRLLRFVARLVLLLVLPALVLRLLRRSRGRGTLLRGLRLRLRLRSLLALLLRGALLRLACSPFLLLL
jgi:hypothetical protein